MKKSSSRLPGAISSFAIAAAISAPFIPASAAPINAMPAPPAPTSISGPPPQYPGNLAMQKLIDDWSGRLVTNDLFKTAGQVQDQIDKEKYLHQVFELFVPVDATDGIPKAFSYNRQSQQLTVRLQGDHQIKAAAFVAPNVHPAVYAYPLYFLGGRKEYSTFNGRTASGMSSELNDVIQDVQQYALVNLPFANTASMPFAKSVTLPPARAVSVARHAMWHMTVETELVPSQKKYIPEDMILLAANTAFPTRYRNESHIVTVALKHADLIDMSDNEIVLSFEQDEIDAFAHRQPAAIPIPPQLPMPPRPMASDNMFPR